MAQEVARLQEVGVPILRGPHEVSGEEAWVCFCDPDNNILEWIQWFRKAQAAAWGAAQDAIRCVGRASVGLQMVPAGDRALAELRIASRPPRASGVRQDWLRLQAAHGDPGKASSCPNRLVPLEVRRRARDGWVPAAARQAGRVACSPGHPVYPLDWLGPTLRSNRHLRILLERGPVTDCRMLFRETDTAICSKGSRNHVGTDERSESRMHDGKCNWGWRCAS
jgi:hypothetical protein